MYHLYTEKRGNDYNSRYRVVVKSPKEMKQHIIHFVVEEYNDRQEKTLHTYTLITHVFSAKSCSASLFLCVCDMCYSFHEEST